jgi:hypothetical protein
MEEAKTLIGEIVPSDKLIEYQPERAVPNNLD